MSRLKTLYIYNGHVHIQFKPLIIKAKAKLLPVALRAHSVRVCVCVRTYLCIYMLVLDQDDGLFYFICLFYFVGMIVTSALIIWKGLMCITGSESPVVVVLSGSMEPGFKRVSEQISVIVC